LPGSSPASSCAEPLWTTAMVRGEGNWVADLLSRDLVSPDHEIRTIINSRFPSQVPKSFMVSPLPAKISSFLSYWVQLRTLPRGSPAKRTAIFIDFHQLMLLDFFFARRSCENVEVSGERRTHPIRKRNMMFQKGGRILPHSLPRLYLADTIAITFEYQKRDKRNNTVTQWRTGNSTYCPLVVSAAVVRRLEAMGASESDFIYKFKGNDGCTSDFDSATVLRMLRGFISSVDFKGLGLDAKRIGLHSLCSSAAMVMCINGVPVYTIMLLGCWYSNAFLRYIRKPVESFGSGVSSKIIMTSRFLHVSLSTNLEDPRTSHNTASSTANMGMGSGGNITGMLSPFGPKIGLPNITPRPNGDGNNSFLPSKTKSPTVSLEPHELFMERCDFVTRCGSAPTAAVATDTSRCKGPCFQPIDCFAVFPRGSGLGLRSQRT